MYSVSVTNNYIYPVQVANGDHEPIPVGSTATYDEWGSNYINVPGMGPINFIDLGDQKLAGYTNPRLPWTESTWGGLIRYSGIDAYFRYEGGGSVELIIDEHGCVTLTFAQGGDIISLDDLTVPNE